MDLQLTHRTAMIAAASKGLGRATAVSLAREGCSVSICGRSEESLADAVRELQSYGGRVLAVPCDVADAADLQRWYGQTVEAFGQVDIVVTNTGGPPAARFLALSEEQWRLGIDSTLMNVIRLSRLALPGMRERKWGRIVHITSLVAKQPLELLTISSMLRAGLSALTKTMSNEFSRDGVLVNAVLPGHVMTDRQIHLNQIRSKEEGISIEEYAARVAAQIPMERFGRPEEIGDVIAFLCSERASYITGSTVQVDGGIIKSTF